MKKYLILADCIRFAIIAILVSLVAPPMYRSHVRRVSFEQVSREDVVGVWIQDNGISGELGGLAENGTFIIFDSNGSYNLVLMDGINKSGNHEGVWEFFENKNYLLELIPWGVRAWVIFDLRHGAGPQFYLKKKDGVVSLHRGDYLAEISENPFRKASETEKLEIDKMMLRGVFEDAR